MKPIFFAAIFVFLFPMYFWSSGLPQVSALFFVVAFLAVGQPSVPFALKNYRQIFSPLLGFIGYTFIVNIVWFIYLLATGLGRTPMFVFSVFYAYNFVVLAFIIYAVGLDISRNMRIFGYATSVSVAAQIIISFFLRGGKGGRAEILFNNPNQLGYFALLSATILAVTAREEKRFFVVGIASIVGCLYLAALSLSKAAMIGCIFLIVLLSILQPKRIIPVVVVLVFAVGPKFAESTLVQNAEARLSEIGASNDDSADGRGYDRIYKFPEHLALGAGEGAVIERFPELPMYGEMHSSFGTVLFSYGIPGSLLFLSFLFFIFNAVGFARFLYLVPSLLYGVTHMGLRFTLFWILIGYLVSVSNKANGNVNQHKTRYRLTKLSTIAEGSVIRLENLPTQHSLRVDNTPE